jgi:hypothetical protein
MPSNLASVFTGYFTYRKKKYANIECFSEPGRYGHPVRRKSLMGISSAGNLRKKPGRGKMNRPVDNSDAGRRAV